MTKRSYARDAGVGLLLAGLCALFFWRILTPNPADRGSFPSGDFANQFYAFSVFEAQEWRAGRLPLWSPYAYSGFPFQADIQSAVFYPPSLVTMAVELATGAGTPVQPFHLFALEMEAIAHFWLASFLTYLFAARVLRSRAAGLVTALTFTYGGYLTGYPPLQLAILETDTWLPLTLLGLAMWAEGHFGFRISKMGGLLLAGLGLGLALLAGHPQSAMLVVYVSLLYLVWRALDSGRRPWRAALPEVVTGGGLVLGLGLALAAVQLLPGFEYTRLSTRSAASFDFLSNGFPLRDLLQIVLPGSVSLFSPLYIGILPLLLVGLGLAVRQDREPLFWGGLGLLALLVSFGGNTSLYDLFYLAVPGFNLFQSQERAALVVSFSLAMLAGFGFRTLVMGPAGGHLARRLSRYAAGLAVILVLLAASFYWGWLWQGQSAESPFAAQMSRAAFAALLAALSWGWLRAQSDERPTTNDQRMLAVVRRPPSVVFGLSSFVVGHGLWVAGVVVLIVFDLFTANRGTLFQPKLPEKQFAARPLVEPMQRDPDVFRVFNEYRIVGNYGLVYGVEDTAGASPLELSRYAKLVTGVSEARLWELLNVKYVLTWRQQLGVPSEVIYQEPKGQEVTYLHRLAHVGPRVYVVHRAEVATDAEALRRLADPAFDPWQIALLAESPPTALTQETDGGVGSSATIVTWQPDRLVVDVDAAADGLLVLSEVCYPGWRASVDGQSAPVLRAQLALRAVPVPAGQHRVEMIFDPWAFKAGAVASGLAWLGLVLAAIWIRIGGRA